jgi:superfamily II DNA or RNA helicase
MKARPYQLTAKEKVFETWARGIRKTMVVMPTGTGKTILFSLICEEIVEQGGRPLILAHRDELIRQAADKLMKSTDLPAAIEKADECAHESMLPVVVGSVQTLQRAERLARFSQEHFTHIVIDECHHATSKTYAAPMDYFPNAKVLGVTATADRADKKNLGSVFDSLAYEYTIMQAIRDGFLAPIKAQTIPLNIDLRNVSIANGDFKAEEVAHALEPYLHVIAEHMVERCRDRKTIVFVPLIVTAVKFAGILKEAGLNAQHISGADEERGQKTKWFAAAGPGTVMVNSMLWTEGFDDPATDCIIVLRPTKSRALYAQMVGRGTRIHPGKENLLLLDFLWLCDKHTLCRPAVIIAETPEEAEEITAAQNGAGDEGMLLDMDALLAAKAEATAKRESALAKQLAEQRKKKAKLVDPLQYAVSVNASELIDYEPAFGEELAPITPAQASQLERNGVNPDAVKTRGHADSILNKLAERKQMGLARPRQVKELERAGIKHAGEYTFEDAMNMIDRIAANGWRAPPAMVEEANKSYAEKHPHHEATP